MLRILLSDRRPVIVEEAEWPVITRGRGESYKVVVRQHKDGRTIVNVLYGGYEEQLGGYLFPAGVDTVAAILETANLMGLSAASRLATIGGLPAETL